VGQFQAGDAVTNFPGDNVCPFGASVGQQYGKFFAYVRSFCPTAALGGLLAAIVLRFAGVRSRNGLPAPAVICEIFTVDVLWASKRPTGRLILWVFYDATQFFEQLADATGNYSHFK